MTAPADRRFRIDLGLQSHSGLHGPQLADLVRLGPLAEASGFDGVVIGDHVVIGNRLDRYPYPPVHFAPEAPWAEPLSVLSAIAAVTSRLRLTTGVLVSPLRPAVLLAKTAATVAAISSGRLHLGLGVGWQPEEFAALGASFELRGKLLDEGVEACRALWTRSPADYSGTTVSFDQIWCEPRPAGNGIPLHFSGSVHARNLRRITRWGAGWITHPRETPERIEAGIQTLRRAFEAAGRDPDSLAVRTGLYVRGRGERLSWGEARRRAEDLAGLGVTDLTIWCTGIADTAEELVDRIGECGRAFSLAGQP